MKTIINYVKEEKRNFKEYPFNEVDSLILSTLSYYNLNRDVPGIFTKSKLKLSDLNLRDIDEFVTMLPEKKKYKELLTNVVKNPRFNNLYLDNYYERENNIENIQFKALTFESDDFLYVAYMGTKTSIVAWKEDFMLSYMSPVPAQKMALKYLNKVLLQTTKKVYVGGHSKGGNLAVYASMHTFLLNKFRIKKIFNHDGPGFIKKDLESINYKKIKDKIYKTIPSTSIVGMLFDSIEDYKVIKSSGMLAYQHSPLNWQVDKSDFIYLKDTSWTTKHIDKTVTNWIESLSDEKKQKFTEAFFDLLENEKFNTEDIVNRKFLRMYNTVKRGLKNVDQETRELIVEVLKSLAKFEKENLFNNKKED